MDKVAATQRPIYSKIFFTLLGIPLVACPFFSFIALFILASLTVEGLKEGSILLTIVALSATITSSLYAVTYMFCFKKYFYKNPKIKFIVFPACHLAVALLLIYCWGVVEQM